MTTKHDMLKKQNRQLQERSIRTYWIFLKRVCVVHRERPWAQSARKILEKEFTRDSVLQLVELADSLVAQSYATAEEHFSANQFASLIRKYPFPPDCNPYNPEENAYRKFLAAEHSCARINQRFRARRSRRGKSVPWEDELNRMRHFCQYVLGAEPNMSLILDNVGFGPGAALGVNGNRSHVGRKLTSTWTVTPGAYLYGWTAMIGDQCAREHMFGTPLGFSRSALDYEPFLGPYAKKTSIVTYNKLAFVPKTAKTFRSIAVEPLLNGYLQKGTDILMRMYLKRIGIDLTLQEPNSQMAREGSFDSADSFVTIDLSSASDSMAIEVIKEILPPDWFDFLKSIRSPEYEYKGSRKRYHKFCSMGNGFCFPLETLLFAAACNAVGAGQPGIDFRVYGDDIVVRKPYGAKVLKLLKYLGFNANRDKTFLEGPFRESCGADWFNGIDVRPYTLDFALDSVQALFKALNGTISSDIRRGFFSELRAFLIAQVPEEYRFFRPYPGPDDSGITSLCDEFLTSPHVTYRFRNGSGTWRWKELIASAINDKKFNHSFAGQSYALMYAALTGSHSSVPFAIRRETRTKVRVISHPGATARWLPPGSADG